MQNTDIPKMRCPIKVLGIAKRTSYYDPVELEKRVYDCEGCPVLHCWVDIEEENRVAKFLESIREEIKALEDIEMGIIHKYRR